MSPTQFGCHLQEGGSFLFPITETLCQGAGGRSFRTIWNWNAFAHVGFRPVRCEARTHRKEGSEMPEDILILDLNLQEPVTPLQGQTHRANLQRTGVHYTKGVPAKPSLKWKFKTGGPVTGVPLAHRGLVYVASSDANIYAIDAESGTEQWRFKMAGPPPAGGERSQSRASAPTIKDGILYQGSTSCHLYALDIRTGRPKWTSAFRGGKGVLGSPVPVYGAVFAVVWTHGSGGGLMAVHGENGMVLTIYRNWFWGAYNTMAFGEGTLVAANHAGCRRVDLRSGSRSGLGGPTLSGFNTPVIHDGRVYTVGGTFNIMDYRSGGRHVKLPLEPENVRQGKEDVASENTLALWNETCYFGSMRGDLYAHDALKGNRLWKTKLGDRIRCAPSISTVVGSDEAIVYVGCDDGHLHAVDAVNGKKMWSCDVGTPIIPDPWIEEGTVYVSGQDGYVYALE